MHHGLAVGFLRVTRADHVDRTIEVEELGGKGKCRSPLPCTCFGRDPLNPRLPVTVGLGNRGIGLMASCRAYALVLVVDLCRGLEELLKPVGPVQGSGSPEEKDVPDLFGYVHKPVGGGFLPDQFHGKYCREVVRNQGFSRARVKGGVQGRREIRLDIIPLAWHLVFIKEDFCLHNKYLDCIYLYIVVIIFRIK